MRVCLAISCFFKVLFNGEYASRIRQQSEDISSSTKVEQKPTSGGVVPVAIKSPRSDAITLLATLQREARFIDIVNESLDGYSDAQIGAAARDVLRDSGKVLNRLFSLQPVVDGEEGASIDVPASYDSGRYRLTGNVSCEPPMTGQLVHAGWQATKCELPAWTGSQQSSLVIAPAEVQVG